MKGAVKSLDNAESIVAHYGSTEPDYDLMRRVHFLSGKLFKVTTVFEPGAKAAIEDHLETGGQILLAANHLGFRDPLVLASMIEREEVFHEMRCDTTIPGNAPLFDHWLYGSIVRRSGAVPVFRAKDVAKLHGGDGIDRDKQRQRANRMLTDIIIQKLDKGMHAAYFPEGTRGKASKDRDPRKLMKLYKGIGHVACGAEDPANIRVVCVGIKYEEGLLRKRKATVAVAMPFEVAGAPEEVVDQTAEVLQGAVDLAYAKDARQLAV